MIAKLNFQQPLQSSVSRDPLEMIICWFGAQETFLNWEAQYNGQRYPLIDFKHMLIAPIIYFLYIIWLFCQGK